MMLDLFGSDGSDGPQQIAPGAYLHHGVALPFAEELWREVQAIDQLSPFRQMITPGGQIMSVSMTNCGTLGWVSDRKGYRYQCGDPLTGRAWPVMPKSFADLARSAAATAGYLGFQPNACLVNRYEPGTRLTLHQDKDEGDFIAPIVSVSLGLPAKFLFGGLQRSDRPRRIILHHGDIVVWGGPTRLAYHGIDTLKPGSHPLIGACRINLTFRSVALPPSGKSRALNPVQWRHAFNLEGSAMSEQGKPTCQVFRASETYAGKQGLEYFAGISAESAGSKALCMHLLTIPPGGRAKAHMHAAHESAVFVLSGESHMWFGDRLENELVVKAGDMVYIPAGVPHLPANLSTEPVTAVIARTDPNEQESVVLLPALDHLRSGGL